MEPKTVRNDDPTTIHPETLARAEMFRRAAEDGSLVQDSSGPEELLRFIEEERVKRKR